MYRRLFLVATLVCAAESSSGADGVWVQVPVASLSCLSAVAGSMPYPVTPIDSRWRIWIADDNWAEPPSGTHRLTLAEDEYTALQSVETVVAQDFHTPWNGLRSPNGLWRVNGPWVGTGGNLLDPTLAQVAAAYSGTPNRALLLSVAASEKRGSEIQTLHGYGYGYYETRMRVASVPGVVASFFWIEEPNYGPHEWDIEFLTNETWDRPGSEIGAVHLTVHPTSSADTQNYVLALPFNPATAFHRYGFLWAPGQIIFTVDRQPAHTFMASGLMTNARGFIMANTWTGNPNWGGGPPDKRATTAYDWIRFTAGVSRIPNE